MTLYALDKKNSRYNPLSAQAIKKLKRVSEINDLDLTIKLAAPALIAMSKWLEQIDKRGRTMLARDLVVARLPNRERLAKLAEELQDKMQAVRK